MEKSASWQNLRFVHLLVSKMEDSILLPKLWDKGTFYGSLGQDNGRNRNCRSFFPWQVSQLKSKFCGYLGQAVQWQLGGSSAYSNCFDWNNIRQDSELAREESIKTLKALKVLKVSTIVIAVIFLLPLMEEKCLWTGTGSICFVSLGLFAFQIN